MEIALNNLLNKVVTTAEAGVLATEKAKLLLEIKNVKSDLQEAYNNFDYVADTLMIDYYTYQIKAYETKFEYLIKKAKAVGMSDF
ncbi:MAG TPA: DUF2508 family protein [Ruminiclostridium sp.]